MSNARMPDIRARSAKLSLALVLPMVFAPQGGPAAPVQTGYREVVPTLQWRHRALVTGERSKAYQAALTAEPTTTRPTGSPWADSLARRTRRC